MRREARFRALAGASVVGALVTCFPVPASDGLRGAPLTGSPALSGTPADHSEGLRLDEAVRRLPLSFEPNLGQFPGDVKFFTRGPGFQLFLTRKEAVFVFLKRERYRTDEERRTGELLEERLRLPEDRERDTWTRSVVRMALEGTSARARFVGEEPLPGRINYLIGNDPKKWRRDIPTYGRIRVEGVYQGIDLVYYGNQSGRLEYDFVVHPGADPKAIRLAFRGPEGLEDAGGGDLVLRSAIGAMVLKRPTVYQPAAEGRVEGSGNYVRLGAGRVGFEIARYDKSSPLVIDPIVFATFLGGGNGNDVATGVAVDAARNIYLAGNTSSSQFPLTPGAFHSTKPPNVQTPFVTKMNPTGTGLIYSTFIGGDGAAFVNGMALGPGGSVIFTGTTGTGYPTTPGAYNRNYASIYVTRLGSNGNNLDYSTHVGNPGPDTAFGLAADASGAAYIVGETFDTAFPTTNGAFQRGTDWKTSADSSAAFVTKVNPGGDGLAYSTFLYGKTLVAGTGGVTQRTFTVAVDGGRACVGGATTASDFPVTPGAFNPSAAGTASNGFVTKLDDGGTAPVFSTYISPGFIRNLTLDSSRNLFLIGQTTLSFSPGVVDGCGPLCTTPNVLKLSADGGNVLWATSFPADAVLADSADAPLFFGRSGGGVITRITANGTRLTYQRSVPGATPRAAATDGGDGVFVVGEANSSFVTTPGSFQPVKAGGLTESDAFLVMLRIPPPVIIGSVTPNSGPGAGGTPITITGSGFLPGATVFIGDSEASVTSGGATSISAVTGPEFPQAGGSNTYPVYVFNPGVEPEARGFLADAFTYAPSCSPLPSAVLTGTTTICAGNSTTLSVALTGSAPWTLYWSDGFVQTGIASSPATRIVSPAVTTNYTVDFVRDSNCVGTGSAPPLGHVTVTVLPGPSAALTAPAATCTGATLLAASVPDGGPGVTYTWTITNGTITSGAGTRSILFSAGAASPLQLSVTVSNGACSASSTRSIPVTPPATAVVSGGGTVCQTQSAPVSVALTGAPPWTLRWSDGLTETGITNPAWTRNVVPSMSTTYTLTQVTDATSCNGSASGSAAFVVIPIPSAAITAAASVCGNSPGNAASVPDAGAGATYTWTIAGGTITAGAGTRAVTFTAANAGSVTLTATAQSGNGCSATTTRTIPISPQSTAALTGPATACSGQPSTLTVALTGPSPWNLVWSDGAVQGGLTFSPATRVVSPTVDTTYSLVSMTDSLGCNGAVSGSVAMTVRPTPRAVVSGGGTVCPGGTVTFSADVTALGAWTLRWNDGITQSGTGNATVTRTVTPDVSRVYRVDSITDTSCSGPGTGAAPATVGLSPESTVITVPLLVCAGAADVVASVPDSGSRATYAWTITNGTITTGQGTRRITFNAGEEGTTTLGVTVAVAGGCTRTRQVTVGVAASPAAPVISGPASAKAGATGLSAEVPATLASTYAWTITNGTITSGNGTSRITFTAGLPGPVTLSVVEQTGRGCPSPAGTYTFPVEGYGTDRTVPVVVSVPGPGGALFTSEMTLTNPGPTVATVDLAYTASDQIGGAGSVVAHDTLAPGQQKIIPDVLAYLQANRATPRPLAAESGAGSLRVSFGNLPEKTVTYAGARTTSASGAGRAGVSYPAPGPGETSATKVWLFGLRENTSDRSNLALVNTGASGPIGLRVTLFAGGAGDGRKAELDPVTLAPGQWTQINSVLNKAGYTSGYALVELVSGTDPFIAYAVFNDNLTNDGSYVAAVPWGRTAGPQAVPVLVETPVFSSELVLVNPGPQTATASLTFVESLANPAGFATGAIVETLAPGEQRVVPNAVDFLRGRGAAIGPKGRSYSGTLLVRFTSAGATVDGFAGARTAAAAPGGGGYGLFCSGVPLGESAGAEAWIFGLQQNDTTRSNLALLNASGSQGPITLQIDVFDGDSGQSVATGIPVALQPGQWTQFNAFLKSWGLSNGYVRVTRTAGRAGWVAYGVLNDGSVPGAGTSDGSYVVLTPGP